MPRGLPETFSLRKNAIASADQRGPVPQAPTQADGVAEAVSAADPVPKGPFSRARRRLPATEGRAR